MQLEALRSFVIEQSAEARRKGRIDGGGLQAWCAGCSTGEEPLSLAITLLEAREKGGPEEIKILATDLSGAAVNRARAARYGEWSFRGVPEAIRQRYFQKVGQISRPITLLREPIAFEQHNLLKGAPGGSTFDIVLCRNVLIYFDRPSLDSAFATFQEAVRPGGLLVLGPAEGAARIPPGFSSIDIDGVILYQRDDPRARRARPVRPAPVAAPEHRGPARTPAQRLGGAAGDSALARSAARREARASHPGAGPTGPVEELPAISPVAMARLAADQGRHDEARALIVDHPGSPEEQTEALVILALVELDSGHLDEAAEALDRILSAEPESLMGRYLMGSLLQALGRRDGACDWFRQALELVEQGPGVDDSPVAHGGGLSRAELHHTLESLLGRCPEAKHSSGGRRG